MDFLTLIKEECGEIDYDHADQFFDYMSKHYLPVFSKKEERWNAERKWYAQTRIEKILSSCLGLHYYSQELLCEAKRHYELSKSEKSGENICLLEDLISQRRKIFNNIKKEKREAVRNRLRKEYLSVFLSHHEHFDDWGFNWNFLRDELLNRKSPDLRQSQRIISKLCRRYDEEECEFFYHNWRFIAKIANRRSFTGKGLSLLQRIQAGYFGFRTAYKKFNPLLEHRFSTYASWWINQAIRKEISDFSRIVRVPANMTDKISKLNKKARELSQKNERQISIEEVVCSDEDNSSNLLMNVKKSLIALSGSISISARSKDEEKSGILNIQEFREDDPAKIVEKKNYLEHLLLLVETRLNKKQRQILIYRFGLNGFKTHNLEEISKKYGVTSEAIRQQEVRAIKKLRALIMY